MTRLPPTPIGKNFNPGKARWCEKHQALECTKMRSKNRGECHKWAVRGTNACDFHSGTTRAVAHGKGEAMITAWTTFGDAAQTIDYKMAVMSVLQMTYLRLNMLSRILQEQVEKAHSGTEPRDPEEVDGVTDSSGLIGFRYGAAGKDGHIFAQGEEIRAMVTLEGLERDRVVRYAKTAHDMGISDRLTGLAERWTDIMATRVGLILDGLDLTPEQLGKVDSLLVRHLSAVDLDDIGGEVKEIR